MKDFVGFLQSYWREIISIITVIISIIFFILKKKKVVNEMDNIIVEVLVRLPEWIISAEIIPDGETKKALVLESVKKFVKDQFSVNLPDSYVSAIGLMIEEILSTPQKKGILCEKNLKDQKRVL